MPHFRNSAEFDLSESASAAIGCKEYTTISPLNHHHNHLPSMTPTTSGGVSPSALTRTPSRSITDESTECRVSIPRSISFESDFADVGPISVQYRANIPQSRRSSRSRYYPCNGIFPLYPNCRGSKRAAIMSISPAPTNTGIGLFVSKPTRKGDEWKTLKQRRDDEDSGYTMIGYPHLPEEIVCNPVLRKVYFLDSSMCFNLKTKQWGCDAMKDSRWKTKGSKTLYVEGDIQEFHGLYHHHDTNYGLRHSFITETGRAANRYIDRGYYFDSMQFLYCGFTETLFAFGGRHKVRRMRKNGRSMKYDEPTDEELMSWPQNYNVYVCPLARWKVTADGTRYNAMKRKWLKWSKKEQSTNLSAISMALPNVNIQSVVVYDQIAVIFQFHGPQQGLSLWIYDLVFGSKHYSSKYLDLECDAMEDLHFMAMEDGIHAVNRKTREHVVIDPVEVMSTAFQRKEMHSLAVFIETFSWKNGCTTRLPKSCLNVLRNMVFQLSNHIPADIDALC